MGACPRLSLWRGGGALPEFDCSGLGCPDPPVLAGSILGHPAVLWGQGLCLPVVGSIHSMGSFWGTVVTRQVLRKYKLALGCVGVTESLEALRPAWNPQSWGLVQLWAGLWHHRLLVTEKLAGLQLQSQGRAGAGGTCTLASPAFSFCQCCLWCGWTGVPRLCPIQTSLCSWAQVLKLASTHTSYLWGPPTPVPPNT